MSSKKTKIRDIKEYPHVVRKWKKTIEWLRENKWTKKEQLTDNVEMSFNWWISGESFKKFYADEFLQQKIKF